jgi:hypothetical protein
MFLQLDGGSSCQWRSIDYCRDMILTYDPEDGSHRVVATADGPLPWSTEFTYLVHDQGGNYMAYTSLTRERTQGQPCKVLVYDLAKGEIVSRIEYGGLEAPAPGMSGDQILTTLGYPAGLPVRQARPHQIHRRVDLWNPRTGERIARVQTGSNDVLRVLISPRGRDLALQGGDRGNQVFISYMGTYKIERTLSDFERKPGHRRTPLTDAWYTPDGSYLMGFATDGTMMLWETKDYREVLWVRLFPSGHMDLNFSPDGKRVMANGGGQDEWDVVKIWDFDQFVSLMQKARGTGGKETIRGSGGGAEKRT